MDNNTGTIAELNHQGDIKYSWDRSNPQECQAAQEHFDSLKTKGFLVFKTSGRKPRKLVDAFNPDAGGYVYQTPSTMEKATLAKNFEPEADYVATPPVVGG